MHFQNQSVMSKVAYRREAMARVRAQKAKKAELITLGVLKREERKRHRISVQELELWMDRRTNEFKKIKRWESTRRSELGGHLTQQQEDLLALARTEKLYLLKYDKWLLGHRQFDRKSKLSDDFKWVTLRRESSAKTLAKVLVLLGLKQKGLDLELGEDLALTIMKQQATRASRPAQEAADA